MWWLRRPRFRQALLRRDQLRRLRARIRATRRSTPPGPEERQLADEMRHLRERISARIGTAPACARCAVTRGQPGDPFPMGDCCGGRPGLLFDEVELAALWASGTRPRHLRWRRSPAPRGCPFCGPTGCGLPPRHRPSCCVRYLCPELSRDLHARGLLDEVEANCQALTERHERFSELRTERLQTEFRTRLRAWLDRPR